MARISGKVVSGHPRSVGSLAAVDAVEADKIERRHYALAGLRAAIEAGLIIFVYFVVPIEQHKHSYGVLRITIGLAIFAAALAVEVRAIIRSKRPMLRAAVAMALVLPLFIVVFAWTYLTMSVSSRAAFGGRLSRISALYFTISVFSTVGFGDIVAKTDGARLAVSAQMLCDLAVVALVLRLLLGAARGAIDRRQPEPAPDEISSSDV